MKNVSLVDSCMYQGSALAKGSEGGDLTLRDPLITLSGSTCQAFITVGDVYWNHRYEGSDARVIDNEVVKFEPLVLSESPIVERSTSIDEATLYGSFFNSFAGDGDYGTVDLADILSTTKQMQDIDKTLCKVTGDEFDISSFKYKDHMHEFVGRSLTSSERERGELLKDNPYYGVGDHLMSAKMHSVPPIRCELTGRVKEAFASFVAADACHKSARHSFAII